MILNYFLVFKMDNSKQIIEKERREEKAEAVILKIVSTTTKGFAFNVYKDEELTKIKYIGKISKDHLDDQCTCHSYMFGNSEDYKKTHPLPFQCKHILQAHIMMEDFW